MKPIATNLFVTLVIAVVAGPSLAAVITGVCPDGSMYIVPRAELIPCRNSKQVAPSDMPPIRPQNLPRPYGWEIFNRSKDPNNPYNVIETGRAVRAVGRAESTREVRVRPPEVASPPPRIEAAPEPAPQPPPNISAPSRRPSGAGVPDLGLAATEVRDLGLIVEYSQRRAPATLTRGGDGSDGMVVRIAQSQSFEARLRDAAQRAGRPVSGPVVLFTAVGSRPEQFYGNLTFVQGHVAFHPETGSSAQLGILSGRLGELAADQPVLGYVVLPSNMDLSRPMDIYWDDRQVTATLRP